MGDAVVWRVRMVAVAFGVAVLGGCGGGSTPAVSTTSTTDAATGAAMNGGSSAPCTLASTEDYVEWSVSPGVQASAIEVGGVFAATCETTLQAFRKTEAAGPGRCSQIARVADNPGYDVNATPAPRLKKVLDEVGGACCCGRSLLKLRQAWKASSNY